MHGEVEKSEQQGEKTKKRQQTTTYANSLLGQGSESEKQNGDGNEMMLSKMSRVHS